VLHISRSVHIAFKMNGMDVVEFEVDEKKDLGMLVDCNLKFLIVIYSATHKLLDEIMGQFIEVLRDRTKQFQ